MRSYSARLMGRGVSGLISRRSSTVRSIAGTGDSGYRELLQQERLELCLVEAICGAAAIRTNDERSSVPGGDAAVRPSHELGAERDHVHQIAEAGDLLGQSPGDLGFDERHVGIQKE